jgi:HlyD family secretion protein
MKSSLIGPLLLLLLSACSKAPHTTAFGTLERDRITLSATASELITAVYVKKGQQVKKGDVLLQLDNRRQLFRVEQAKAEMDMQKAALELLRLGSRTEQTAAAAARVNSALALYQEAAKNYQRQLEVKQRGLQGQAAVDSALAQRDSSKAQLDNAKQQLAELEHGNRPQQIQQAEFQLVAATTLYQQQQLLLDDLTIKASRDAVVDDLPWKLGERVNSAAIVAVLQADSIPYARVYLPEPYLSQLKVGDHVQLTVDHLTQTLSGKIRQISAEATFTPYYALNQKERSRLMFLTEIDLDASAAALPTGLPVQLVLP